MGRDTAPERGLYEPERRNPAQVFCRTANFVYFFCGYRLRAGSYSSPQPSPGPSVVSSVQGSWEIQFQSDGSFANLTILEANLTQAGTKIFAGTTSALVYEGTTPQTSVPLTSRGGKCDNGGVSQVTLDGMLTNQQPTTERTTTFTLTEVGALGTAVVTASGSTDGSKIIDGTYTIPAACGFPAEHGTFAAFKFPITFGSDTYSGTLNGGTDVIVAIFTSTANSFDLAVSGTDNGSQFVLTGSTVGFSVSLTGTIDGQTVNWFGLYDPTYNSFQIYDSNDHLLGALSGKGPFDYSQPASNS